MGALDINVVTLNSSVEPPDTAVVSLNTIVVTFDICVATMEIMANQTSLSGS